MSGEEILSTKVTRPNTLVNRVERSRLAIKFDTERFNSLTLVCAPAGYGKTTLISSSATTEGMSFAWLSLDATDNNPAHFLVNLVAAIANTIKNFGNEISRVLQSSNAPPIASLGTKFINDISSRPGRIVLFLDDYHVIDDQQVHQFIIFLLEHQPKNLHIVIASRAQPPFSVARLRTHGRLHEITEADLRFTVKESEDYFNRVMSLGLSESDVEALRDRTEGWAAALQLAALSLRGDSNIGAFIDSFSGIDRHVKDFLMDEVLSSLSEPMQSFLFRTSIVERFSTQLCDVLTDRSDSAMVLAELERLHMFLVPLDGARKWYRYHHLFSELLQSRLSSMVDASELDRLHIAAANWFSGNGFPDEAIRHAMAGHDNSLAAKIIDQYAMSYITHGKISTVVGWIKYLPEATIVGSPAMTLLVAFSIFFRAKPDVALAERYLKIIDQAAHSSRHLPRLAVDEQILARVMLVRGYQARYSGDIDKASSLFKKVCDALPKHDLFFSTAMINLGICHFVQGHLEKASAIFSDYAEIRADQPNLWITVSGFIGLARIHHIRGDLQSARNICEAGLQEFSDHGFGDIPVCCLFHFELGELEYEADSLVKAAEHGKRAMELAIAGGMEYITGCSQINLALVKLALGEKRGLNPHVEQKLLDFWANNSIVIPSMSASLSKLWLLQGRAQELAAWYDKRGIDSDVLRAGFEMEYMMVARMLLRRQRPDKALNLLLRLLSKTEDGQRAGLSIEILILLAMTRHGLGNLSAALDTLNQALHLAKEGGYVRLFVDEGLPMLYLLQKLDVDQSLKEYQERLLSAFSQHSQQKISSQAVVPMTGKEVKVAKLIASGLSNEEIAAKLFVSPHTIKSHVKSIYRKLGVSKRSDAVVKIREMNLA